MFKLQMKWKLIQYVNIHLPYLLTHSLICPHNTLVFHLMLVPGFRACFFTTICIPSKSSILGLSRLKNNSVLKYNYSRFCSDLRCAPASQLYILGLLHPYRLLLLPGQWEGGRIVETENVTHFSELNIVRLLYIQFLLTHKPLTNIFQGG